MLPVAGRPILEWGLEALEKAGVRNVYVVVGFRKDVIKDYFGKKYGRLSIRYLEQKKQLGTANAVAVARGKVKGDFIVMNGDVLVTKDFISTLVQNHVKAKSFASMSVVEVKKPQEYGIVDVRRNRVAGLEEKPARPKSNLANAGVYVFNESIFDLISKVKKSERREYEITDAIKALIKNTGVHAFKCGGQWIDIGTPWNLLDANEIVMKTINLFRSKKAVVEKNAVLKGRVAVGDRTTILSGAYIEGPVYIGRDCRIGPNCYIRPYTVIMDGCHVGNAAEIKNSIIMPKTNVGHLSYVGDSIIGERCNFGAGTLVANLRFDNQEVAVELKNQMVKSGRRKFGCLMGDNVKTGINVSIMPGRSIYPNATVEAASVVKNTIYGEEK